MLVINLHQFLQFKMLIRCCGFYIDFHMNTINIYSLLCFVNLQWSTSGTEFWLAEEELGPRTQFLVKALMVVKR